jgi:hypothetical protein
MMAPFTGGVQLHVGAGFVVEVSMKKSTVSKAVVVATPAAAERAAKTWEQLAAAATAKVEAEFESLGIDVIYSEEHEFARCGVGYKPDGSLCRYSVSRDDGVFVEEIDFYESARVMAVLSEARSLASPDPGTWHSQAITRWLYSVAGSN